MLSVDQDRVDLDHAVDDWGRGQDADAPDAEALVRVVVNAVDDEFLGLEAEGTDLDIHRIGLARLQRDPAIELD